METKAGRPGSSSTFVLPKQTLTEKSFAQVSSVPRRSNIVAAALVTACKTTQNTHLPYYGISSQSQRHLQARMCQVPRSSAERRAARIQCKDTMFRCSCLAMRTSSPWNYTLASRMVKMRSIRRTNCPKSAWFLYACRISRFCSTASRFA